MLKKETICSICEKVIQADEEIYAKTNYPKQGLMVEIKAYLNKNSEIICRSCFEESKI